MARTIPPALIRKIAAWLREGHSGEIVLLVSDGRIQKCRLSPIETLDVAALEREWEAEARIRPENGGRTPLPS